MRQIDIINELNKMVIGYNITWDMIKYDADRAIMKINAHLGAEYPMMSEIMLSPEHRYVLSYKNVDTPIFPERYILTVVIPFIATEVLARDEEFTTIYNKYAMDFENGLFDMSQNEFNRVPLVFRQDPDIGVFFDKGIKEHKIHKENDKKLPEFMYNIYYHFNADFTPTKQFTIDPNRYAYKTTAKILDTTIQSFIKNIYSYEFLGWTENSEGLGTVYTKDDEIIVTKDIHLYAKWNPVCVLTVADTNGAQGVVKGEVRIKDTYVNKLKVLTIPPYIEGRKVEVVPTSFNINANNLVRITLPKVNIRIMSGAFNNTALQELIFPSYDYLRDQPNDVRVYAEALIAHSIKYLYIPYSVSTIGGHAFNNIEKIQCEIETNPSGWSTDADGTLTWTDCTKIDWGVANG